MSDFRRKLTDPGLIRFYDYWAELHHGRSMPTRKDIDPLEMPRGYLPNIMLVDVLPGSRNFRYRLVGTNVVNATGEDRTGKSFKEVRFFREHPVVLDQYEMVIATHQPIHSLEPFTNFQAGTTYDVDCLLLPLSDDGQSVNTVLVLFQFNSGPYAARLPSEITKKAASSYF
jgi:hypothetical protein